MRMGGVANLVMMGGGGVIGVVKAGKVAVSKATEIADGHAYIKHVLGVKNRNGKEYGSLFESKNQFIEYLTSVITNPSDYARGKDVAGRATEVSWDSRLGTMIIYNNKSPTAYVPDGGYQEFIKVVNDLK